MRLYWSPDYVGGDDDTLAKSARVIQLLKDDPNIDIVGPDPVTMEELLLAHSRHYIESVFAGSVEAGMRPTPALLTSVRASTGGAIAAASTAVAGENAGSASSGLHHARRGVGNGFCTFNGLAVAARYITREYPAATIHIVDLDAHCGGGTWNILGGDENVSSTDVAVDWYDHYLPERDDWTMDVVTVAKSYISAIGQRLPAANFDLVLYNAGMDPWEGSYIGGLKGITAKMLKDRDEMVFEWANEHDSPVAFVFAGGYGDLDAIARLHAQTVRIAEIYT